MHPLIEEVAAAQDPELLVEQLRGESRDLEVDRHEVREHGRCGRGREAFPLEPLYIASLGRATLREMIFINFHPYCRWMLPLPQMAHVCPPGLYRFESSLTEFSFTEFAVLRLVL